MRRKNPEYGYFFIVIVIAVLNILVEWCLHALLPTATMVVVLTGMTMFWCVVLMRVWKSQGWIR
jgi:hypothetical protein